jgi:hypothetical protein
MALIHKNTFDIIQDYGRDDPEIDNYFEIDDLIALTISILNKKGYTTTFCCAGHPFIELCEAFSDSKDSLSGIVGINEITENSNSEMRCKYVGKYETKRNECYISFTEPVYFDVLPTDFSMDDNHIDLSKRFSKQPCTWACIEEIVENMKQLYLWSEALPDNINPI